MRSGTGSKVVAVTVVTAALALVAGSSASAPAATAGQPPHISHPTPVPAHLFGHSVRTLPQAGPFKNTEVFPRPKWAGSEGEPGEDGDIVKAPLPGAEEPPPTPDVPEAPAPGPGGGGDPFSGAFPGLDHDTWGAGWPPDTNGDVGPNYYIQTINTSIGIFNKAGGAPVAAFTFNTFMSQGNFGNLCDTNNFGDPVVLYDSFEDRWVITDFAFTLSGSSVVNPPGAFQCFAVSKTGDPVSGGWNFYSISAGDSLDDYPKFGVWPDGIYMAANQFNYPAGGSFKYPRVWAFNKAQMYAGSPAVQVITFNGPPADLLPNVDPLGL